MGKEDQKIKSGLGRYQIIPRVLVFLRNGSDILMIKGAPNKRIWANQYNGVGGHVEIDEDVLSAARREVNEETGLEEFDLQLAAVVNIDAGDPNLGILMFVFSGYSPSRITTESAEGKLEWIPIDGIKHYNLVEDLFWLLPNVLRLKTDDPPLFLHYCYNEDDKLVIQQTTSHFMGSNPVILDEV